MTTTTQLHRALRVRLRREHPARPDQTGLHPEERQPRHQGQVPPRRVPRRRHLPARLPPLLLPRLRLLPLAGRRRLRRAGGEFNIGPKTGPK